MSHSLLGMRGGQIFGKMLILFTLLGKFKTTEINTLIYTLTYLTKDAICTSYAQDQGQALDQTLFARSFAITIWPDNLRGNT